jgi:hypothetical protein
MLVSEACWVAGTGLSTGISGQLWNDGSYLAMYDSISGQVMRINKTSCSVAEYATKAQFLAAATTANGGTTQTSLTPSTTALTSSGDLSLLDGSKGIYETTGQDAVTTLIAPSVLTTGANGSASASVSTFTVDASVVFVGLTSKGFYEYNTSNTTWTPLFTPANIESVTGSSSIQLISTGAITESRG